MVWNIIVPTNGPLEKLADRYNERYPAIAQLLLAAAGLRTRLNAPDFELPLIAPEIQPTLDEILTTRTEQLNFLTVRQMNALTRGNINDFDRLLCFLAGPDDMLLMLRNFGDYSLKNVRMNTQEYIEVLPARLNEAMAVRQKDYSDLWNKNIGLADYQKRLLVIDHGITTLSSFNGLDPVRKAEIMAKITR